MLNNRFAREALKQAATQVNQGVRDGARQFVEREITPLRDRIDELEGESPASSDKSPSSCANETGPGAECRRRDSRFCVQGVRARTRLANML